ncbi:MAG: hypothetical protein A2V67_10680 [Deltaproteobacteria bacterium RBG_13_61_14]|nr:MAG: hypothetical protein A2V67_10680 [Deltaproteobacteria bacterium RBG_13_61_14]
MKRPFYKGLALGIILGIIGTVAWNMFEFDADETIMLRDNLFFLETHMDHACGLLRYAPVKIMGITSGKIEKILLEGEPGQQTVKVQFLLMKDRAKYIARSNPNLNLKADVDPTFSYARSKAEGSLGDSYLDIHPGDPRKVGVIEDGGTIRTLNCLK